jgi:alpha/beta superfamily hydrolase
VETELESGGVTLRAHLALPPASAGGPGIIRHGLVLCHGFPPGPKGAATAGQTYPQLADRLAADAGWAVLTFNFRGAGESQGDFSLGGWLADVRAAIEVLSEQPAVDGVWLAGFSTGGSLALCAAGEDERVKGVASFAAPADFGDWSADPRRFLDHAREVGVVKSKGFPPDFDAWARELREIRPLSLVGKVPPRPVLIVHGTEDEVVPLVDARALADAAGDVELRVLSGAGHRLRHDPRAIAVLLGWLDRQQL